MVPKIQIPTQTTIANWCKKYPEYFGGLLLDVPFKMLYPFLEPEHEEECLFGYIVKTQSSRIVTVPMTFDESKDELSILKMNQMIIRQAYVIKLKYELLAQTVPTDIEDYFENYKMSRQKTRHKEVETGTITNSGNDVTYNNVHSTSTKTSSTGETEQPRFDNATTTSTGALNDQSDNSMKTNFGRIITSAPGDEDISERTTAHGYYNSGTKADMIRDIRDVLKYSIVEEWVQEILPAFCCATYDPSRSYPAELVI